MLITACGGPDDPDPKPAEGPDTAHWMADVFADRPDTAIGRILLPGAFNSSSYACEVDHGISPDAPAAVLALWGPDDALGNDENRERIVGWARTQDRPIGQQLVDGIRFVEVNVTVRDGALTTWHSVYGVPLDEVLDEIVAFSVAWPDEVVVLSFGLSVDSADYPLFADALLAPHADGLSVCDRLYDGPEAAAVATLADVRASGRNLLWAPDGELRTALEARGCPLSSGATERVWSITVTPEGVEAAIAGSVDSRDPAALLVNDFVFSLDGSASVGEQLDYTLSYSGVQEASQVLGFSGDFPERLIAAYDAGGNLNVLAGAYYQDTNLVQAAIARNGERSR